MKIVTVVGARPQFIKATAVSHTIAESYRNSIEEVIIHTGQHFDDNMSAVFFDELMIPAPRYNLGIAGGSHATMTGRMMAGIEAVLEQEHPDHLLVYGDTNSTLAGSLAAVKLGIPIAHVEAGVRSFRLDMPEEVNRLITDRIATHLFCPTASSVLNLQREGITRGVFNTGDVTCDILRRFARRASSVSRILDRLELDPDEFVLATCHRAENVDHPDHFRAILDALSQIRSELQVVVPLHPRARKMAAALRLDLDRNGVRFIDPLPFFDMLALEQAARVIITDSGGMQKEAFCFRVPCITLRAETEWTETVMLGANSLAGASTAAIVSAFQAARQRKPLTLTTEPFGSGHAGQSIVAHLVD